MTYLGYVLRDGQQWLTEARKQAVMQILAPANLARPGGFESQFHSPHMFLQLVGGHLHTAEESPVGYWLGKEQDLGVGLHRTKWASS